MVAVPVVPGKQISVAPEFQLAMALVPPEYCELLSVRKSPLVVLQADLGALSQQAAEHELHSPADGISRVGTMADSFSINRPFGICVLIRLGFLLSAYGLEANKPISE
jgi:hypothetical protein